VWARCKSSRSFAFVIYGCAYTDLGSSACITSILRLKHLEHFGGLADATWDDVGAGIWSAIENSCAVICACLPTLRPLMAMMFPRLFGTVGRQSHVPLTNETGGKGTQVRMEVLVSTEIEQSLGDAKRSGSSDEGSEAEIFWTPGVESVITGQAK
jgi:hypothetical protein